MVPSLDMNGPLSHLPVLSDEVVRFLAGPPAVVIDATVGAGGHAGSLLAASGVTSRLLGVDLDLHALRIAERNLERFGSRVVLVHGTFADLGSIARQRGWDSVTGILFDLGLRTDQLDASRGFSFTDPASLDMRFDATGQIRLPDPSHQALLRLARRKMSYTAADILARVPARDLAEIFRSFGDERHALRIAHALVRERERAPISTASDLAAAVVRALPPQARHGRLHAATRVFQALRMAVNRELESLRLGLRSALDLLQRGGRVAVISYHSGEDRLVKHLFREAARSKRFRLLTKRPLQVSAEERQRNVKSRSAKLRILERFNTT